VNEADRIVLSNSLSRKWKKLEAALAEKGCTVVTTCNGNPEETLSLCARLTPCVLVVDEMLVDEFDPEEFSAAIDFGRAVQVLVESTNMDVNRIERLISLGCAGILRASAPPAEALRALRVIGNGELWASRSVLSTLLRKLMRDAKHGLTARESEILALMTEGLKNVEIAERLFISPQTVRWHLRSLYAKLGTHDRMRATVSAGMQARFTTG
jgi:DNA-binding NarL/FixJ family response regulator